MTSGDVAAAVGGRLSGAADVAILGITHDSTAVEPGWLFCAVKGVEHDGADFASDAVRAGAVAVLTQRPLALGVPEIVVADVRASMASAARAVHHDPSRDLTMIGVTGTNGKTTVVALLTQILGAAGINVAEIGTLTGARTTPEATDLQAHLRSLLEEGVTHVVMEVSSHALVMGRVDGIVFDAAVFTNLGRDHLDFHDSQETYFAAKARLFDPDRCRRAVLNTDDVHGRLLSEVVEAPVDAFGLDDLDGLRVGVRTEDGRSVSTFTWRDRFVELPLGGRHNVSNALAAAETANALGVATDVVAAALGRASTVPGRFEVLGSSEGAPTVVVDYAHTPDALENVIEAAAELRGEGGDLVVVFGCGGDRDRAKRPEMGAVATAGADVVVVTNDNPRSEDPMGIINEVLAGCDDSVVVEPDRRKAIRSALTGRGAGDVVLIAGKGHETGQQFADRLEDFDDRVVAAALLAEVGTRR